MRLRPYPISEILCNIRHTIHNIRDPTHYPDPISERSDLVSDIRTRHSNSLSGPALACTYAAGYLLVPPVGFGYLVYLRILAVSSDLCHLSDSDLVSGLSEVAYYPFRVGLADSDLSDIG